MSDITVIFKPCFYYTNEKEKLTLANISRLSNGQTQLTLHSTCS